MLNLDRHDFTEPWRRVPMILGSSLPIIGLADVKERAVRIEMAVDAKSRFSRRRLRFGRERATGMQRFNRRRVPINLILEPCAKGLSRDPIQCFLCAIAVRLVSCDAALNRAHITSVLKVHHPQFGVINQPSRVATRSHRR